MIALYEHSDENCIYSEYIQGVPVESGQNHVNFTIIYLNPKLILHENCSYILIEASLKNIFIQYKCLSFQ